MPSHARKHTHTHTHKHTQTHTHTHTGTHTQAHTHTLPHTHTNTHKHKHTNTHTGTHTHSHTHARAHTHTHKHTQTHTHKHTHKHANTHTLSLKLVQLLLTRLTPVKIRHVPPQVQPTRLYLVRPGSRLYCSRGELTSLSVISSELVPKGAQFLLLTSHRTHCISLCCRCFLCASEPSDLMDVPTIYL